MRKVTTEYRCDRCGESRTFSGDYPHKPSHWMTIQVSDGGNYVPTKALVCLSCRRQFDEWMRP